tara:strand:+ start:4393 stop:5079 length:687 start_codon:yes stop_codon:yes gene_type:complete
LDLENRILFEDNHLIIINKKAGELVQGDKTGDKTLADKIKHYIKQRDNKPSAVYLGIVHRLDRPTSGVVAFAKTSKALSRLNNQFKSRVPKKVYWAIVNKDFLKNKGSLIHWMTRNKKQNKSKAHKHEVPNSKIAHLNFKRIYELNNYCVLEILLETGRHHQIRAQLSKEGFPIHGDLKYGAKRSNLDGSISLHARQLSIEHPVTKKNICFTAKPMEVGIWRSVLFYL